jgi:serine protease Do
MMTGIGDVAGQGMDEAMAMVADGLRRSVVRVRPRGRDGGGAGVIWRPDGLIVTNAHVVRGGNVDVELADGRVLAGTVADRDPARDLASVRVAAGDLPAADVAHAAGLRAGDLVIALGHPHGWVGALSVGVVHSVERAGPNAAPHAVRAALRLAPGNSGGPLADARGRVVGINTMVARGLGVAIPTETVERFLGMGGRRQSLGARVRPVRLRTGGADGTELPGWLVLEIVGGGLAQAAGLLAGDVLTALEGRPVRSPEEIAATLDEAGAGAQVRLELVRGGRWTRVDLRVPGMAEAA